MKRCKKEAGNKKTQKNPSNWASKCRRVIKAVAKHRKTTPQEVCEKKPDRNIAMHIMHETLRIPAAAVGKYFGVATSTVSYCCNKVIKQLSHDHKLSSEINGMVSEIFPTSGVKPPAPLEGDDKQSAGTEQGQEETVVTETGEKETEATTMTETLDSIAEAICQAFFDRRFLASLDPISVIRQAKDAIMYLTWKDYREISLDYMMRYFGIDETDFQAAIGRILIETYDGKSGPVHNILKARELLAEEKAKTNKK